MYLCRIKLTNYITNAKGKQVAVQIPIENWLLLQKEYENMKREIEILTGIKDALEEVHGAKKENKKLQSLTAFLHEC